MSQSIINPDPSTLPRGIGAATLAFFVFSLVVPTTLFSLLGTWMFSIAEPLLGLTPQATYPAAIVCQVTGDVAGLVLTFGFFLFPLQFLDGRAPIAVSAFRVLGWGFIAIQACLLVGLAIALLARKGHSLAMVPLPEFVGIPLSPMLYFLARSLLTSHWLDLAAPPEAWEPLVGIDGSGRRTIEQRGGRRSSPAVTVFLTPIACLRAKLYGLATLSAALWLSALLFLLTDPLRALIPLAISAIIGRQVILIGKMPPAPATPMSPDNRIARIRTIFTSKRLQPPPRFMTVGSIGFLIMMVVETGAVWLGLAFSGIGKVDSLAGLSGIPALWLAGFAGLMSLPVSFLLPMGISVGLWWYRIVGAALVLAYVPLLGFFWHLADWPFGPIPAGVRPVLQPVALTLSILSPVVLALALSLPRAGNLPNLVKASVSPRRA